MAKQTKDGARDGEVSATECARHLALTQQAVGMWASRPGAPVRKSGTRVWIRFQDFARWREQELIRTETEKLRTQIAEATAVDGGHPAMRKLMAEARKAEIEVALLERSVVRVDEALGEMERVFTELRNGLLPFPRIAAPKAITAKTIIEMERVLEVEVHRLMDILAHPPTLDNDPNATDDE